MTPRITLSLEPRHLDIIMGSLAEQPFKIVAGTVTEINKQIAASLSASNGVNGSGRMVEAQVNGDSHPDH